MESVTLSKQRRTLKNKRLTEVIIPKGQNADMIVYPLVASISRCSHQENSRDTDNPSWLTWVTDSKPNTRHISQLGASADALRIIHAGANKDYRWIIWEALHAGNSHTVIADLSNISHSDIEAMEIAAKQGNCSGIIINKSQSSKS